LVVTDVSDNVSAPPPRYSCPDWTQDGADKLPRDVCNYPSTLHNVPEERRSHFHTGGSQKSRIGRRVTKEGLPAHNIRDKSGNFYFSVRCGVVRIWCERHTAIFILLGCNAVSRGDFPTFLRVALLSSSVSRIGRYLSVQHTFVWLLDTEYLNAPRTFEISSYELSKHCNISEDESANNAARGSVRLICVMLHRIVLSWRTSGRRQNVTMFG